MKYLAAGTAILLALGLGCAGMGGGEFTCEADSKASSLTTPYNDMCLQIGDGEVEQDGTVLLAAWEDGDVSDVTEEWNESIEGMGWTCTETLVEGAEGSDAEIHTVKIYQKDGTNVGFLTGQVEDDGTTYAFVYMENISDNSEDFKEDRGKSRRENVRNRRPGRKSGKKSSGKKSGSKSRTGKGKGKGKGRR